jgi:hypothetical protein
MVPIEEEAGWPPEPVAKLLYRVCFPLQLNFIIIIINFQEDAFWK